MCFYGILNNDFELSRPTEEPVEKSRGKDGWHICCIVTAGLLTSGDHETTEASRSRKRGERGVERERERSRRADCAFETHLQQRLRSSGSKRARLLDRPPLATLPSAPDARPGRDMRPLWTSISCALYSQPLRTNRLQPRPGPALDPSVPGDVLS